MIEAIPDAHLSILEDLEENESFNEQKKMLTFAYQQIDIADDNQYYNEDKEVKMEMGSIKVNKSKEAMSDKDWGSVDKTALRKKVVEAENFKEIADDIFLDLREGWEDGEVSKLKYPVMEINGDEAVYNRGGLGSAKAYAEKITKQKFYQSLKRFMNISVWKKMKKNLMLVKTSAMIMKIKNPPKKMKRKSVQKNLKRINRKKAKNSVTLFLKTVNVLLMTTIMMMTIPMMTTITTMMTTIMTTITMMIAIQKINQQKSAK